MGEHACRGPLLAELYRDYLDTQKSAEFVSRVGRAYNQGTLERLAVHPLRGVRRAAVLALGFMGTYEANAVLGRALNDEDRTVRVLAETGIRSVWARAGDKKQQQELALIIRCNSAGQHEEVIRRATQLIEVHPDYAEAWNQRAVAYFRLNRYDDSIRDCQQALEINPYHFAAAAGMGQAYLRQGRHRAALETFRRALKLNPDLEGVRVQAVRLAKLVEDKSE